MFTSPFLLCHLNENANEVILIVDPQMAITKAEYEDSTMNP